MENADLFRESGPDKSKHIVQRRGANLREVEDVEPEVVRGRRRAQPARPLRDLGVGDRHRSPPAAARRQASNPCLSHHSSQREQYGLCKLFSLVAAAAVQRCDRRGEMRRRRHVGPVRCPALSGRVRHERSGDLGSGRIVASDKDVPNMLVNLVWIG